MLLNEIQKQEIATYVAANTRYRETYNELYDHVLSALAQEEQATFHMDLVVDLINADFGGVKQIRQEEEHTKQALYGSFSKMLRQEMLYTLKFPAVIQNLSLLTLGLIFYFGKASTQTILSVTIACTLITVLIPLLLFVYKAYIRDRKQGKPSISDFALRYNALFGLNTATCVFYISFSWDALTAMAPGTLIAIMWGAYFFLRIFLSAYLKVYNRALRLQFR